MSGFLGEFFGTMVLILLGGGCGAGVNLKDNYARGQIGCSLRLLGAWR